MFLQSAEKYTTVGGGRPSVMLTIQPWQMRATGISLIREHSFRLQSPLSLRLARQVQQPWRLHSSLRSCVVSWKKSLQSHSLCPSCPLIRHDQRDDLGLAGLLGFFPCLEPRLLFMPWGLLSTAEATDSDGLKARVGDSLPSRATWFTVTFGLDTGSFPGILACTSAVK